MKTATRELEERKAEFVDAKAMNRKYPDTFEVPNDEELAVVRPGDFVKVCPIVSDGPSERFWVEVHSHSEKQLTGVVGSDLICTDGHGLRLGDRVAFEERNVYQIDSTGPVGVH